MKPKKLNCHCGQVEIEVKIPEEGFKKFMRCNCSLCKRKGAIMSPIPKDSLKVVKGQEHLKLYQYHTKVAEHYFCKNCGIYTHHRSYTNPENYEYNVGCIDNLNTFEYKNIPVFDGEKL